MSYLNTVPLVRGLRAHPDRWTKLDFERPAACADRVRQLESDIGLIPVAELLNLPQVHILANTCIACDGPVRSILLVTTRPWHRITTLAADENSRTSVNLARIILAERYGVEPAIHKAPPNLSDMLEVADAALIIGDPALYIDPQRLPYEWLDLGEAWFQLTHLPMVFAAWAGHPKWDAVGPLLDASLDDGLAAIDEIVSTESSIRELSPDLVRTYLTQNIRYRLGERERLGLATYLDRVRALRRA